MQTVRSLRLRRLVYRFVACLLLFVLAAPGCAALAVGAAAGTGVAYAVGDQERVYPYPMDVVWNATQAALIQSQLAVASASHDHFKGRIDAYTATGDRIKLTFTNEGAMTRLNLRVNTFGDRPLTTALLQNIDLQLAGLSTPPQTTTILPQATTALPQTTIATPGPARK